MHEWHNRLLFYETNTIKWKQYIILTHCLRSFCFVPIRLFNLTKSNFTKDLPTPYFNSVFRNFFSHQSPYQNIKPVHETINKNSLRYIKNLWIHSQNQGAAIQKIMQKAFLVIMECVEEKKGYFYDGDINILYDITSKLYRINHSDRKRYFIFKWRIFIVFFPRMYVLTSCLCNVEFCWVWDRIGMYFKYICIYNINISFWG